MSLLCCFSSTAFREPDISLSLDPSATSLLDGQLLDQSGHTLYQIETADAFTKISPVHSARTRRSTQTRNVMSIRWPQRYGLQANNNGQVVASAPDALVTVNGETTAAKRLLRRRKLVTDGKSHKFRIHGYKPTFRWKQKGRQYLLYISGNRQPIAYLSSDFLTTTFRLEVYGAFIPSYHAQDRPGLVSSILLDHVVLTSLLLVTPPLEWRRVCGQIATRTTLGTVESDDIEEPPAFIYSTSHRRRQGQALSDPFDDSCAAPTMREAIYRNVHFPSSTTYADSDSVELVRQPSRTSSSSSRTLVQNLVRTVLASISSDESSLFVTTEDSSSYYGHSISSQSPPPPYQPASSRR